jgi:hypothetical protein
VIGRVRGAAWLIGVVLVCTHLAACTIPIQTRSDVPCAGIDAGAFRLVWSCGLLVLEREDGRTFPATWPTGYSAEHRDGEAVVLDGDGDVVAREGEVVRIGGGGEDVSGTVMVCSIDVIGEEEP